AGRRRTGDDLVRGPRRRPHPAARPVAGRQLRGPRGLAAQRHGDRRQRGLRQAGEADRRWRRLTRPPSGTGGSPGCSPNGSTARDVVRHLTEWFPAFLAAGAGIDLPRGPSADEDPVAAWQVHSDGVQWVLDDPRTADRKLTNEHIGTLPLAEAIDRFYTAD